MTWVDRLRGDGGRWWRWTLVAVIYLLGAAASFVAWKWAAGRQNESFPIFMLILAPPMVAGVATTRISAALKTRRD